MPAPPPPITCICSASSRFAYMWARMAKVAQDKIAGGGATPYLTTKLVTGRFFMERMLPETTVHLARIQTGCATTMELAAEAF